MDRTQVNRRLKSWKRATCPLPALVLAVLIGPGSVCAVHAQDNLCSNPGSVFCTGFEEGNFAIWDDYDGNPAPWNALVSDPGPRAKSGNTVARLRVPEGPGGTDLVKVLPTTAKQVYVRWFQKWEPGYDFAARNHGSGIHAGDRSFLGRSGQKPNGTDMFSVKLEPISGRLNLYVYYPGMYQDCADPNGACWGDHFPCFLDDGNRYCTNPEHREREMPPLLETDRWYCLEVMVDSGDATASSADANGRLNLWIDGIEYGPWQQLWFRSSTRLEPSILWMNLYHHAEHSVEGLLLDDIVVSQQRVGCSASPVAPPKPPTDVRAEPGS